MTTIKVIDTHCHLEQNEFDNDRDLVIERAISGGVHMICSGIDRAGWRKCLDIAKSNPYVSASLGLDPVLFAQQEEYSAFLKENQEEIIAVGEVGLDHYRVRDHKERNLQAASFRDSIRFAQSRKLPIQVHSRSAGRSALEILQEMKADSVHMHAFDGKASLARVASTEYGFYFSIPTSVVRSAQKRKLVKAVDIERILVETDSPVLGPNRESRNEPVNVWVALRQVAGILGREEEEMREILLENTIRLYPGIRTK
ncbi:MAG: TatD family hydrolase [Candidatus Thorarchaeota archaeon]